MNISILTVVRVFGRLFDDTRKSRGRGRSAAYLREGGPGVLDLQGFVFFKKNVNPTTRIKVEKTPPTTQQYHRTVQFNIVLAYT